MARLTEDVKRFLVQQLACFREPSEVAASVKEIFGVEVDRRQVWGYNPEHGQPLGEKWARIFAATREEFLRETGRQGISHQAFRLRELGELYSGAKRSRNLALAAQVLEQAAKESGGSYTNRREVRANLTLEQALAALADEPTGMAP